MGAPLAGMPDRRKKTDYSWMAISCGEGLRLYMDEAFSYLLGLGTRYRGDVTNGSVLFNARVEVLCCPVHGPDYKFDPRQLLHVVVDTDYYSKTVV